MKKIVKKTPRKKKVAEKKPTRFYRVSCPKCDSLVEYDDLELAKHTGTSKAGVDCPKKGCNQFLPHYEDYRIPTAYEKARIIMDMLEKEYNSPEYIASRKKAALDFIEKLSDSATATDVLKSEMEENVLVRLKEHKAFVVDQREGLRSIVSSLDQPEIKDAEILHPVSEAVKAKFLAGLGDEKLSDNLRIGMNYKIDGVPAEIAAKALSSTLNVLDNANARKTPTVRYDTEDDGELP